MSGVNLYIMERLGIGASGWILLLLSMSYGVCFSWGMDHGQHFHSRSEGHDNSSHRVLPQRFDFEWANHGGDLLNQRKARQSYISATTVTSIRRRWAFTTGSDVTATPAIAGGNVYFPAWNGMLYAVDEETGRLQWRTNLLPLADGVFNCSRATPVVWKDLILVSMLGPAIIVAINRHTGAVVWTSPRLDSSFYSMITMSGTAHDGYFYVGTSSSEEVYDCCSFQGSFFKLDISDGSIVWKTSMLPAASGYYGAALWGSSPSIDEHRHLVFIATGNNYKVPASVETCENERLQNGTITPDTCLDPANRMDSIVALSMDDGSVVWSRNLQAYDAWTLVCVITPTIPYCPDVLGPDYDFGEAPMIIYLKDTNAAKHSKHKNESRCIVVAGQKSGFVWALDCDTGSIVWSTAAGPGGTIGGAIWGSCTDGKRVYTNIANSNGKNFTLAPGNEVTNGGGWVAMDAATGEVLWSTAEPSGGFAWGPLSVADGVVFATSYSAAGDVFGLDARTGAILWHNTTGAGIYGGVSISKSCVFVGNGYHKSLVAYNGTAVTAFCISDCKL